MQDPNFTAFFCPSCRTEIEATLDMAGEETECPACGAKITVPRSNESDGVVRHGNGDFNRPESMKSRTIRIEHGEL